MNNMRKLFALAMIAVLALGLSVAVMGCGQQAAQEETAAPPATETMSAPDTSMMMDTTMADTTTTPSH